MATPRKSHNYGTRPSKAHVNPNPAEPRYALPLQWSMTI